MDAMIAAVAEAARAMCEGPSAVALGGSLAKGVADAHSDLDIYVFAEHWRGDEAREAAVVRLLPTASGLRSWSAPPTQAGTDFVFDGRPVEVWLRQVGPVRTIVENAMRGEVNRQYVTWTPNGFYDHCALADLATLRIISDPDGLLTPLVAALATYPPALKATLVARGLASAKFWRGNFHLETALVRADSYYLQSLLQQILTDLVQALFAVNAVYFPGDKKLARHFAALERQPARLQSRFEQALLGQGTDWRQRFGTAFGLADDIAALAQSAQD